MPLALPPYSERDYLAPTVYFLAGVTASYNYYSTLQQAFSKLLYLSGKGGSNLAPAGSVQRIGTGAQTFGINVDFYALRNGSLEMQDYKTTKQQWGSTTPYIIRFYTTGGAGPYYAILDKKRFGISATTIDSVGPEKLLQLDLFYREVQLLKYRYNCLVGFLNTLAKRQLSQKEQQIFNEGLLKLQTMQAQMSQIKGLELTYTTEGAAVGFPVIAIIIIIAILAAVTGWALVEITAAKEKTKQINDSYNLTQWVATKKTEIAQLVTNGQISPSQAADINKTLDGAASAAAKVAENANKDTTTLGNVEGIVKWGVFGLIGFAGIQLLKTFKQAQA